MDPARSWPDTLPAAVPVFPLAGALLLPDGRLPLNIFEPRYLAMVEDALAAGRMLGMVLPDPAHAQRAGRSTLYRVGCLGRIASFAETEDGRYLITLLGVSRFRVLEELPDSPRGYRRVRTDYTPYAADRAEPPALADERAALLGAVRTYFQAQRIEADWAAIDRMATPTLVTTLCMVCPFTDAEKQALLEAPDLRQRSTMLVSLMQMDSIGPASGSERPS
ncbi:LON peptidase substrate-binding domain-containing protein [Roseomonas sp. E05]|uniref:LON peptidase substrate-binding domain-containing protein n=1 Tax=Roseomonas sp. E05 TaxID=3046310 RepID=UPI0024B98402|nr:LON peptidase substrate-binding domain-containing protein [Roseomonas sp. E05]MDJ0391475.1 LON peptidase substrate-binding domain-containing protein [Roseomonas sp. E05]